MSSWGFSDAQSWGGRPIATSISEVLPRARAVLTGTLRAASTVKLGNIVAYECVLEDGSGKMTLVFVGRHEVPGLAAGSACTVEGTVQESHGRLEVWNPRYRIELDVHVPEAKRWPVSRQCCSEIPARDIRS